MASVIAALLLCVLSLSATAGMVAVPHPARPSNVPATVVPTGDCVGVSNTGVAACNTYWAWKGAGRFGKNYYRYLASTYNGSAVIALKPLTGDTDTTVGGITPNGKPWGRSSLNLTTSTIVTWDALGNPTSYGPGTANDADDLGRIASGASIYNPALSAWIPVVHAYAILALSNSGDAVGVFTKVDINGIEHANLYRLSDYATQVDTEDACTYPCLAALTTMPAKTRINPSGVVAWHLAFATGAPLGLRAIPGSPILFTELAAFSGINSAGDIVGSDKIVRLSGPVTTIPASGGFTAITATGINAGGVIVGAGTYAGVRRGFVLTP